MPELSRAHQKLLTISIPTFNRSGFLDLCLGQICKQLQGYETSLEVIISNNASTDDTEAVVQKYIERGYALNYLINKENIGAEKNVAQCFSLAKGKYVLVLGDDDLLLDGAIAKIIDLLKNNDVGVVSLKSYGYKDDWKAEKPQQTKRGHYIYDDPGAFIRKVHYWFTFISANIVNKNLIDPDFRTEEFFDTNLPHLGWIIPALFKSEKNIYVEELLLAFKVENTGGYQLCKVFGVNMNRIFSMLVTKGTPAHYFKIINRELLLSFFPLHIFRLRKNRGDFEEEEYFKTLYPVFGKYPAFWVATVPVIILPLPVANLWYHGTRVLNKLWPRR